MRPGAAAMSVRNVHQPGSSLSHDRPRALARDIRAMRAVIRRGEPQREITVIIALVLYHSAILRSISLHLPAPTSTNLHPPPQPLSLQSHRSDLNRRPPGSAVPPLERKTLRHKEKRPERSPAATRKGGVSHPESATQVPRTPGRKRPRSRGADSGP